MTATRSARKPWLAVLAAVAVAVTPAAAPAQETPRDPIAAEALFERGKALFDESHIAEACAAFAESERLDPAGGTLLRLALCHEAQGKLASAWLEYLEVVRISRQGPSDPAKLAERVRIAREHLAQIEPRVPKLAIRVPAASRVERLHVSANGMPRNEGTWDVALPCDPGDVAVVATAPGRAEFRATVHVVEGQQLAIDIPSLAPSAAPPPNVEVPHASVRGSTTRPIAIAVGALGVVALGVGAYFGARAIAKWNDSNSVCPGTTCTNAAGVSLANDAKDSARVADVTLAAGAVAVVAGVVLYVLGAPAPTAARGGGGITLTF
jgi:hypothetical protein